MECLVFHGLTKGRLLVCWKDMVADRLRCLMVVYNINNVQYSPIPSQKPGWDPR